MELMTPELYVVNRLEKVEAEFDDFRKHIAITLDDMINEINEYRRKLEIYQQIVNLIISDIVVDDDHISLYASEYQNSEKFYTYKQYFKKLKEEESTEETTAEESTDESPVTEDIVEETKSE